MNTETMDLKKIEKTFDTVNITKSDKKVKAICRIQEGQDYWEYEASVPITEEDISLISRQPRLGI